MQEYLLSGLEFNALFGHLNIVKVIRSDYSGSMQTIRLGLNECDYAPYSETISSSITDAKNGFYFSCDKNTWIDLYESCRICQLSIPLDATIHFFHSVDSCVKRNEIISCASDKIMVHSISEPLKR